jgi:uncharacterized protein (TIGR00730 family)
MSNGIELSLRGESFVEDLAASGVISAKNEKFISVFGAADIKAGSLYYKKCVEFSSIVASAGISVMTGGGTGIMEAANSGAKGVSKSYGLQVNAIHGEIVEDNQYVDDGCSLSFNTLSIRLLTLISNAAVGVFFPGGFGTLEEMFSLLVRVKVGMMNQIPIYLFGAEFWKGLESWLNGTVKGIGAISDEHTSLFKIEDDVKELAKKVISHCS